jgi:uncharacterized OB-fold protein
MTAAREFPAGGRAADQPFTMLEDGRVRLVAGRRPETGEYLFPLSAGEVAEGIERCELPADGILWTFTVQRIPPKSPPYAGVTDPAEFEPFGVGYVRLGDTLMVEGRIIGDVEALRPGLAMRSVLLDLPTPGGGTFRTFAFQPMEREGA